MDYHYLTSFYPIFFRRASFYIKICVKTVGILSKTDLTDMDIDIDPDIDFDCDGDD